MYLMRMPQLGMGMTDADIMEWLVREGQVMKEGDSLVTIDASKAEMTLEAPVSGTLRRVMADVGSTVPVGDVIALIGDSDEPIPDEFASKPLIGKAS